MSFLTTTLGATPPSAGDTVRAPSRLLQRSDFDSESRDFIDSFGVYEFLIHFRGAKIDHARFQSVSDYWRGRVLDVFAEGLLGFLATMTVRIQR
ncbi:hypothetical protein U1Q18_024609 [Sarracenia purpurea var. burkii]